MPIYYICSAKYLIFVLFKSGEVFVSLIQGYSVGIRTLGPGSLSALRGHKFHHDTLNNGITA